LATPLVPPQRPIHVLNVSVTTKAPMASVVRNLEQPLRALTAQIQDAVSEIDR
jgi:hypothetical protein